MRAYLILFVFLAACTTSDDPAEGGFFSGVAGITGGGYEQRIAAGEAAVAAEEARQAELEAEYADLRATLTALKAKLAKSAATIRSNNTPINSATETRVRETMALEPVNLTELREAVAKARELTEELERLSL